MCVRESRVSLSGGQAEFKTSLGETSLAPPKKKKTKKKKRKVRASQRHSITSTTTKKKDLGEL